MWYVVVNSHNVFSSNHNHPQHEEGAGRKVIRYPKKFDYNPETTDADREKFNPRMSRWKKWGPQMNLLDDVFNFIEGILISQARDAFFSSITECIT